MLLLKQKIQFKLCPTITYRGSGQPECVRQPEKYFSVHSATVQTFQIPEWAFIWQNNIIWHDVHNICKSAFYQASYHDMKIQIFTSKVPQDYLQGGKWFYQPRMVMVTIFRSNDCHKRILSSDRSKPGFWEIFQSLYNYKNCFALWEF